MEYTYTENEVRRLLNSYSIVLEEQDMMNPDDDLLLGIYDMQMASSKLKKDETWGRDYPLLYQYITEGCSVNEITNLFETYERDIYRMILGLVSQLTEQMNKGR